MTPDKCYILCGTSCRVLSILHCNQKLLNGAIPVPVPTIIIGTVKSFGRWNNGAL